MAAATLLPTEDETFDALFGWIAKALDLPDTTDQIVKGFQNLSATPNGSYVVISPGIMHPQDFSGQTYDPENSLALVSNHLTYSYQVDCYGQAGPNQARILFAAWKSTWTCDFLPTWFKPLYADAPQQLNIVNSEGQFEQRFMIRLFGQVNQTVGLPQDFFDQIQLDSITVADQLP